MLNDETIQALRDLEENWEVTVSSLSEFKQSLDSHALPPQPPGSS